MLHKSKRIAVWGVPPPPFGGMTVHIKRLFAYLKADGWEVTMYNFFNHHHTQTHTHKQVVNIKYPFLWYLKLIFGSSPRVHYVITTRGSVRFLAAGMGFVRRKRVFLRVGGRSLEREINSGGVKKWLNIMALKLCFGFIGVNKQICDLASRYANVQKVHHIPGFIPPPLDKEKIPADIVNFFNKADLKLVVTGLLFPAGQEDVYGMRDVFMMMKYLKETHPMLRVKCCMVTYDAPQSGAKERMEFQHLIDHEKLNAHLLLYRNNSELWPIINAADIFLRPSHTDGDANSIREALYLKKIVVASDCTVRPPSCITYRTGNIEMLANAVLNAGIESPEVKGEDEMHNLKRTLLLINNA